MKRIEKFCVGVLFAVFPLVGTAVERARLVCDEPVCNFGRIDQHAVVTNVFTVRNEGDLTFAMKYLRTSCSCAKARIKKRLIAPGESTAVTVVYTAARRKGPQRKTIYLMPVDSAEPALTLSLEGFVEAPGVPGKSGEKEPK